MRILVAYSMSSTFVQTTLDYLLALKRHLRADVEFVHVTHGALMDFDFSRYDVIFHNYCSRLCFPGFVSDSYLRELRRFAGLKVLAVQDEYDETDTLKTAIRDLGFDVVLTCVPPDSLEYVYPRADFPDVRFEQVFTGYVSDDLATRNTARRPLKDRDVVVGYRGRDIGGRYGQLGYEKYIIGVRMKEICIARGVRHDIAVDEASRIYGTAWFDFVGNCRAMLGSESGSNVFDFDGSIARRYRELSDVQGGVVSYEAFAPYVAERERAVQMGQISPRVFECAVMRTPMVLFRGRYSDAITPDEHYIALEKDFSNADAVLDRLDNVAELDRMTVRAHDHLVASGLFSYAAFASRLQTIFEEELSQRRGGARGASARGVPADPAELWIRGQRPTAAPGDKRQFEREQGRYHVGVYGNEVRRLDRVIDDHVQTLFNEAARLGSVYRGALSAHGTRMASRLFPEALPVESFAAVVEAAGTRKSAFERECSALEQAARSDAPPVHDAWSTFSARLQARIGEINEDLAAINAPYSAFIGRSNALILLAELRRQENALAETWSLFARERDRLETVFAGEHRRLTAMLARTRKVVTLPERLDFSAVECAQRKQETRRQEGRMLSETLLAPSGDLLAEQDWQVTSARLRAQIDAIGTDATTADTCWTSAVTAANAQFRDLARAARNAAGLRGLPAQLRMDAVRVWSAARRSTRTVIRKGASLMRTAGPRANGMVQTARAVWRRLRAG